MLVLGGAGFIGRHAVQALLDAGCTVIVGSRHALPPSRTAALLCACPWRAIRLERCLRADDWRVPLAGIDVVVNCVGILRERREESYEDVHHRGPAALAQAAAALGVRLIQISALGLAPPLRSGFLRSKFRAEQAIAAAGGDWCIVRPSLLDAERSGFGARWLRRIARWPIHPLPTVARGRIAALDVRDLGEALAQLALRPSLGGEREERVYELGGSEARCLADLLGALRAAAGLPPAQLLPLPHWLARLGSHACDLLHFSPFSFGHLELLQRDNCPSVNRLPELLGRAPRRVGAAPIAHPTAAGIVSSSLS